MRVLASVSSEREESESMEGGTNEKGGKLRREKCAREKV